MSDRFSMSKSNGWALCAAAALAGLLLYRLRVSQKWDAAVVGTLVPFWYTVSIFRDRWARLSLWTSVLLCLLVHLLIVVFVFAVLLRQVSTVGLILCTPVVMIEIIPLYAVVDVLERKLRTARPRTAS